MARTTWSQGNLSFIANSHHFINSSEYTTDLKMTDIFIISLASAIRWLLGISVKFQLSPFKEMVLKINYENLKVNTEEKKVNPIETLL